MKTLHSTTLFLRFSILLVLTLSFSPLWAQDADSSKKFTGISVSPSTIRFSARQGESKMENVRVKNDTDKKINFRLGFSDFIMGENGKPQGLTKAESPFALSRYASVAPAYFELNPGESREVVVSISIPSSDEPPVAAWTILMIDQVVDRGPLAQNGEENTIALGILPSVGFGVYIYQNPPGLRSDLVSTKKLELQSIAGKSEIHLEVVNEGTAIGFCLAHIELTNLATGKTEKLKAQKFNILPSFTRSFRLPLPEGISPGKYSLLSVIDTGNPEEVNAVETEVEIKP